MRLSIIIFCLLTTQVIMAQNKQAEAVKSLLEQQAKDWNNADIDAFMEGYWESEDLQFIGSKGVTYGWQQTKDNYKRGYPDKAAMGELSFDLLGVNKQSKKIVSVTGKFILKRESGEELSGYFLLIVKKIKGKWLIIADHTSG
ncbi:MAG: ketosteroid isomerase-like protein [Maribacter sp.]|jgi:ketosteroid isomerase-like protein